MGCGGSTPAAGDSGGGSGSSNSGKQPQKKAVSHSGKNIEALPSSLPADVQELDISENASLTGLDGIGRLSVLEKLDANSCALAKIPDEIEGCAALEELLIYKNKLKELPAKIGSLGELTTFNCFNNQIKKLPAEVGTLTKLEEVNAAANKLMMLTDAHFSSWGSVKILSLYDNNLVRIGSLAPLAALEELRISGNNLEDMPGLSSHPKLTTLEIHKNRIVKMDDNYFDATPALERLSIWGNMLEALPPSLPRCASLKGIQAQQNKLSGLPDGWPASLETLFLQENTSGASFELPASLKSNAKLMRVNLGKLNLEGESATTADALRTTVLAKPDGIFWGVDGVKSSA